MGREVYLDFPKEILHMPAADNEHAVTFKEKFVDGEGYNLYECNGEIIGLEDSIDVGTLAEGNFVKITNFLQSKKIPYDIYGEPAGCGWSEETGVWVCYRPDEPNTKDRMFRYYYNDALVKAEDLNKLCDEAANNSMDAKTILENIRKMTTACRPKTTLKKAIAQYHKRLDEEKHCRWYN